MPAGQFSQRHAAVIRDNGSESSATIVSYDSGGPVQVELDTPIRVRFTVQRTSGSVAFTPTLYYSKNSGTWAQVLDSDVYVRPSDSSAGLADMTLCAQRLPGAAGSWYGTGFCRTGVNGGSYTNPEFPVCFTEYDWCVRLDKNMNLNSDVFQFRMANNTTVFSVYSYYPWLIAVTASSFKPIWAMQSNQFIGA